MLVLYNQAYYTEMASQPPPQADSHSEPHDEAKSIVDDITRISDQIDYLESQLQDIVDQLDKVEKQTLSHPVRALHEVIPFNIYFKNIEDILKYD